MTKIAFLFPGQGAQKVGMGAEREFECLRFGTAMIKALDYFIVQGIFESLRIQAPANRVNGLGPNGKAVSKAAK